MQAMGDKAYTIGNREKRTENREQISKNSTCRIKQREEKRAYIIENRE